jgi:hypothetical protein
MRWIAPFLNRRDRAQEWARTLPWPATLGIGSVLGLIFGGIVQTVASNAFMQHIWPWLIAWQRLPRWFVVGGAIVLGLVLYGTWRQSLEIAHLRALADEHSPTATQIRMRTAEGQRDVFVRFLKASLEIHTMMRAIMPELLYDLSQTDTLIRKLTSVVIKHAQQVYGHHAPGACLYLPDDQDARYLTIFDHVSLDEKTLQLAKWYIGPDLPTGKRSLAATHAFRRGTAGSAYKKKKAFVRHINPQTLRAEEGNDYVSLHPDRHVSPFLSFVALPIIDGKECLGILCLDSPARDTFDDDPDFNVLQPPLDMLGQLIRLRHVLSSLARTPGGSSRSSQTVPHPQP